MTPLAVFVRTLMNTSAIFIGVTVVMLHPSLEWSSSSAGVTTRQSPAEAAIEGLVGLLKDTDAGVRRQAAAALGEIGNPRAVPSLIEALKDADPDMRQRAISALGEIGDARAVGAIAGLLKDSSPSIRTHAAMALGELQDRAAVDPLIAAIRDANADVRRHVVMALGEIADARALQASSSFADGSSATATTRPPLPSRSSMGPRRGAFFPIANLSAHGCASGVRPAQSSASLPMRSFTD